MPNSALTATEAQTLAREAYTFGFAIVENHKALYGMCLAEESPQFSGFNHYLHGRRLFDADYDLIVNANNDTLYSTTFADLRAEPILITVPPTGDRYFSIQLVDMTTDNFTYIGTRATGRDGGTFLLHGPRFSGVVPEVAKASVIAASSDFVALATRTAVDGEADIPEVARIQDRLVIRTLSQVDGAASGRGRARLLRPCQSPRRRARGQPRPPAAPVRYPAEGDQGGIASVRRYLLPPLPPGGTASRADRHGHEPHRFPVRVERPAFDSGNQSDRPADDLLSRPDGAQLPR